MEVHEKSKTTSIDEPCDKVPFSIFVNVNEGYGKCCYAPSTSLGPGLRLYGHCDGDKLQGGHLGAQLFWKLVHVSLNVDPI